VWEGESEQLNPLGSVGQQTTELARQVT